MAFILDKKPKFCDGKVTFNNTEYTLRMINDTGGIFMVSQSGIPQEEVVLTVQAMRAMHFLLSDKTNL